MNDDPHPVILALMLLGVWALGYFFLVLLLSI